MGSADGHSQSPWENCCCYRRQVTIQENTSNKPGFLMTMYISSSGIGLEIVRRLSLKGAKVYLTTRCEANAQKALDILRTNNPEIIQRVACLVLDLSNLKSVTDAANELKKKESKVDILGVF